MRLTTVNENGCIKRSQCNLSNPTPWDNPVEFTKRLYWSNSRTPGVKPAQDHSLQIHSISKKVFTPINIPVI